MRARAAMFSAWAIALVTVLLALPAASLGATWPSSGESWLSSFADQGGLVAADSDASVLTLPYEASTVLDGSSIELEPRSIRVCADGSYLVACGKHGYIKRISSTGVDLQTWTAAQIPGLTRPFDATELADGGMLIVDRKGDAGQGQVIRVDSANHIVWTYGGTSGLGAGELWDPFSAELLPNGHILIADSLGFRVIEIDSAGSIVWSYGSYKVSGPGAGLLVRPHSAQRLSNGNTLICDSDGQKVIEATPDKRIAWSYGTGVSGSGPGQLKAPNFARRLDSGNILICDSDNNRLLEVDRAGHTVQAFGEPGHAPSGGALSDPRAAVRLADGSTLVADNGNHRLERYRFRTNHWYKATSAPILPTDGKVKWFTNLTIKTNLPPRTAVFAQYSTNGSTWNVVPRDGNLPNPTTGASIRYRVSLSTSNGAAAPSLLGVSITWQTTAPTSTGTKKSKKSSKSTKATKSSTTTTSTPSVSAKKSTTSGTAQIGAGRANSGGSGSNDTTTVAPGSGSSIGGGTAGSGGNGVSQATNRSGWVMSEVKDDVGGVTGASGTGGFQDTKLGQGSGSSSATLLLLAYSVGLAWSPAPKLLGRLITMLMTH